MKKAIVIFLIVVVLVFGGIFTYVSLMDWNTQKDRLSAQLSDLTGKKINFSGNLQVDLLPQPQLSADYVEVVNPQSGAKLATVKRLKTEVSLLSLLKGKPDIQKLSLDGVEVWFEFNGKGVSNWHQKEQDVSFTQDNTFNLHNFGIGKSVIHIKDNKHGIAFDLTDFNAEIQAGENGGPYRLDGNFLKDGKRYGIALGLDILSRIEDMNASLALTHPDTESNFRYDGTYNVSGGSLKGIISGQSAKTADLVNSVTGKNLLDAEYNVPVLFSADVSSDDSNAEISDLVIKLDKFFEGSGKITMLPAKDGGKKRIGVKYQMVSLDFRPFLKFMKEKFAEYKKGGKFEPDTDFDVFYDLSSERVTVNSTSPSPLENVSAKGEWKDNIFSLDDFYAACPGNMVLNLKASLQEKESVPQYYLGVKLSGQNLLPAAEALGLELKSPRQSSYRDADLEFDLYGDTSSLNITDAVLKMDKAEIKSSVSADLRNNEFSADINADILNLDNYLFPLQNEDGAALSEIAAAHLGRLKSLSNRRAAISVKADSAAYNGIYARNLDIDLVSDGNGEITVANASAENMLGTDAAFSGNLKNAGGDELLLEDITYDIKSAGLKLPAEKAGLKLSPVPLFENTKISLTGVLGGTLRKIYTNLLAKSGEHSLHYDGYIDASGEQTSVDGKILLKTGHTENLIRLLSSDGTSRAYRGPLVASGTVKGSSKKVSLADADVQMGTDKYHADLDIENTGKIYKVTGAVKTDQLNLKNWVNIQKSKVMPKFGSDGENTFIARPDFGSGIISYDGLKDFDMDVDLAADKAVYGNYGMNKLHTRLENTQNNLVFKDLSYENDNHKVSGTLSVNYAQSPLMTGKLSLYFSKINDFGGSIYGFEAGDVNADADFTAPAASADDMISGLSGNVKISGKALKFRGIDLAAVYEDLKQRNTSKGLYRTVRANVQTGETSFDGFSAAVNLDKGMASFSGVTVQNNIAQLTADGSVNLKEWKINTNFAVGYKDLQDLPGWSFIFSGMMARPSVDISVASLAGKYDEEQRKIAEAERVKLADIRKQLTAKAGGLLSELEEVKEKRTNAAGRLENALAGHFTSEIVSKYNAKNAELEKISNTLEEVRIKLSGELSDEVLASCSDAINNSEQQITHINADITSYFEEDTENKKNELITRENTAYTQASGLFDSFKKSLEEDGKLLSEYGAPGFISQNTELAGYDSLISEGKNSADKMHSDFGMYLDSLTLPENNDKKHEIVKTLNTVTGQEESLYARMQEADSHATEILASAVNEYRKSYEETQRKAEEKRRREAEKDAQNLLLNTGLPPQHEPSAPASAEPAQSDTASSPAENTENALQTDGQPEAQPEAPQPETAPAPARSGIIKTKYDADAAPAEAPHKSGLLTPVTGPVQKPTGTIKLKTYPME